MAWAQVSSVSARITTRPPRMTLPVAASAMVTVRLKIWLEPFST
jgi:hypothetical protein